MSVHIAVVIGEHEDAKDGDDVDVRVLEEFPAETSNEVVSEALRRQQAEHGARARIAVIVRNAA